MEYKEVKFSHYFTIKNNNFYIMVDVDYTDQDEALFLKTYENIREIKNNIIICNYCNETFYIEYDYKHNNNYYNYDYYDLIRFIDRGEMIKIIENDYIKNTLNNKKSEVGTISLKNNYLTEDKKNQLLNQYNLKNKLKNF